MAIAVASTCQRIALISVDGDPAAEIGSEEAGGQNVYVRQVGEALAHQGWQVDLFTRQTSSSQETVIIHNANCRTIRLPAGPKAFVPRDNLFRYLAEFVQAWRRFQQQEGIRYELIHTNYWLSAWVGMELKKVQRVKQVHTYHSLGSVKYQIAASVPKIARTRLGAEKLCLETAERVVATSSQEEDHMRAVVPTASNITLIPCGTDVQRFGQIDRGTARLQLGIFPAAKVVLYVGRFDPRKGIESLVRAISLSQYHKDPNFRLIIGGGSVPGHSDGKERERIEGLVQALSLTAITLFPGRLDETNLHLYYAAADVCVVPSHYEPFGLVAIEAMASRTPVVASCVGGLQSTVITEETGLLVPPLDEVAFAGAIDRILANSLWRDQLGEAGRKRVIARFTWSQVAKDLGQLYEKLLEDQQESTETTQKACLNSAFL